MLIMKGKSRFAKAGKGGADGVHLDSTVSRVEVDEASLLKRFVDSCQLTGLLLLCAVAATIFFQLPVPRFPAHRQDLILHDAHDSNIECSSNADLWQPTQIIELDEALLGFNDAPVSHSIENEHTNWMARHEAALSNKSLSELTLPGTHDSGAFCFAGHTLYNVDKRVQEIVNAAGIMRIPVEKLIADWSLAQDRTIRDQLMEGVRYLDVRAIWDGSDWRVVHGLTGPLLTDVLSDIAWFANQYPKEILVVEVSVYDGNPGADACGLLDMLSMPGGQQLGSRLVSAGPGLRLSALRVGYLVREGQNVALVTNLVREAHGNVWPASAIYNTWADTPKLEDMIAYNEARASEATAWAGKDSLYKLSFTLTPHATDIVASVLPGKRPRNLEALALGANARLRGFVEEQQAHGRRLGNVLIVDYWEHLSDVVDLAVLLSLGAQ